MKKIIFLNLFLLEILVIPFLTSCGDDGVGPVTNSLEENYARWKKLGIVDYTITQQKLCFCADRGMKAIIQVRGNNIVSVIDSITAQQIPQDRWQWFKTIDGLFQTAISAQNSKPSNMNLHIEQQYGFPDRIWVDPSAQIADEEYGFTTTSFRVMK